MSKHAYDKPIRRGSKEYHFARKYLKENGIKYRFRFGSIYGGGWAHKEFVQINMTTEGDELGSRKPISVRYFLSAVFHEASHVFNYRDGKFEVYHNGRKHMTLDEHKTLVRTALRAEVYTDHRAKKIMHKHYPKIPYLGGYDGKWLRERFKKRFVGYWRERLQMRLKRKRK